MARSEQRRLLENRQCLPEHAAGVSKAYDALDESAALIARRVSHEHEPVRSERRIERDADESDVARLRRVAQQKRRRRQDLPVLPDEDLPVAAGDEHAT